MKKEDKYKLNKHHVSHSNGDGYITKNGHTMFNYDIVKELNQSEAKDKEIEELKSENDNIREMYENVLKYNERVKPHVQMENIKLKEQLKAKEEEVINEFIKMVKDEFKEMNLDYLDFIKDRLIVK